MRVKWYCHATFLIKGDGRRIIADPYDPVAMHFQLIHEPTDIVIRSSGWIGPQLRPDVRRDG